MVSPSSLSLPPLFSLLKTEGYWQSLFKLSSITVDYFVLRPLDMFFFLSLVFYYFPHFMAEADTLGKHFGVTLDCVPEIKKHRDNGPGTLTR